MSLKPVLNHKVAAMALIALMATTRFYHFGTQFSLPDASLAVFFLAGLWAADLYWLMVLLAEAVLIDYLAITQFGVSDFCVSAGYVFLLPAYLVMWLAGRWSQGFSPLSLPGAMRQFAALLLSTSLAYVISSSSFYVFSANTEGSLAQYVFDFATYYPPYLTATLIYGVVMVALVYVVKSMLTVKSDQRVM